MIKLYVKIMKQNGKFDTRNYSYNSEEDCLKDLDSWFNNPSYTNIGYHVGEGKEGQNKYYLNLKSVT